MRAEALALLALCNDRRPSVVQFRRGAKCRPDRRLALLVRNFPVIADAFADGSDERLHLHLAATDRRERLRATFGRQRNVED